MKRIIIKSLYDTFDYVMAHYYPYGLEEFAEKADLVMDEMYTKAIEMGGEISGEHGIGHSKVKFLEKALGAKKMELMQGIKKVFDPNNILNPGKVCEKCD